jgi:hypothetical protein
MGGHDSAQLVDRAGECARRGFTEHIIALPALDAVRVASRTAEVLPELRALGS